MAGIISQMSANKKRTRQKTHAHIPSDKCVYTLQAFDPCFNPLLHNKYVKGIHLMTLDNKLKIQKRDYEIEVCIQVTRFLSSEEKMRNISVIEPNSGTQKKNLNGMGRGQKATKRTRYQKRNSLKI